MVYPTFDIAMAHTLEHGGGGTQTLKRPSVRKQMAKLKETLHVFFWLYPSLKKLPEEIIIERTKTSLNLCIQNSYNLV